jgi:hypothetical protein
MTDKIPNYCMDCAKCQKSRLKEEKNKRLQEGFKTCKKCKKEKSKKDFHIVNHKIVPVKYRAECKECRKLYNKQYAKRKAEELNKPLCGSGNSVANPPNNS